MKKGVLEMCVLSIVSQKERYGYEIAKSIREFFPEVSESTIYSILRRLKSEGSVETFHLGGGGESPVRKYYRICPPGTQALTDALGDWEQIEKAVNSLCFPE